VLSITSREKYSRQQLASFVCLLAMLFAGDTCGGVYTLSSAAFANFSLGSVLFVLTLLHLCSAFKRIQPRPRLRFTPLRQLEFVQLLSSPLMLFVRLMVLYQQPAC